MKTSNKVLFILCSAIFLLSSCTPRLSPFTQSLYEQNDWSTDELKRIQFYLSEKVVLRRQNVKDNTRIDEGKVEMRQGRAVEEIVIPRGTPGILSYLPGKDRFAISFEEGKKQNRTLIFGPDSRTKNRYVLKVVEWRDNRGIVRYDDKNYYVLRSDAVAALMIDLKKLRNTSVKTRVAKGNEL